MMLVTLIIKLLDIFSLSHVDLLEIVYINAYVPIFKPIAVPVFMYIMSMLLSYLV